MKLLRLFAQTSPRSFWLAILLGVMGGVAGMGLVAEVNHALGSGPSATLIAIFIPLCAARLIFAFGGQFYLHVLGQSTMYELRSRLSRSVVAIPQLRVEQIGSSRLLAAMTDDVMVLTRGGYMLASVITQFAFVVACAVYLGSLSLGVLGIVILTLVAGVGVGQVLSKQAGHLMSRARDAQDSLFEGFRGISGGTKELKLHAGRRAEFVARSLEEPARIYRRNQVRSAALGFISGQWTSLLFLGLVALLLFEAPKYLTLDTTVLRSYVLAVLYMQASVEVLLRTYPQLQAADIALGKLEALGLSIAAAAEVAEGAPLTECREVELRGVVHEYHREEGDGVFGLGPINCTLHPGEISFIVGGNGSGKSTLVKLLTGLYPPQAGEIRVDGRVVDDGLRPSYRQLFSAVFSDWFLFDRLHGIESPSLEEDAKRYLEELRLDKKVTIKDRALSTTSLSQGQRKRLMMLTAYLEDRPIYVFDEWASDQDPTFKEVFYKEILPRLKARGKIVVVVSHDDHYFSVADRIIRLEDGRLVSGNPEQAAPRAAISREPALEGKTS